MFRFKKSSRVANIVIDDYVIRMIENNGRELSTVRTMKEKPMPEGIIAHGKVTDELAFFQFIKELVKEWGIKNRDVRFYVPDSLVIMKTVEIPENLADDEINEFFLLELGLSLHLPFSNPILDVDIIRSMPAEEADGLMSEQGRRIGTLFAVPEDEMLKFSQAFIDASLHPVAADVRALGIYRYFNELNLYKDDEVYMFFELNLTSISLSIFSGHQTEFLRYMDFDLELKNWQSERDERDELIWEYVADEAALVTQIDDYIVELERIMNFYRYSMHKGQKVVTHCIVLGDFPNLEEIVKKIESRYELSVRLLEAELAEGNVTNVSRAFIPALGLALKGED